MIMAFKTSPRPTGVAGQATYGMSNLRPDDTGLPFVVFISQKDDARHAARIKWSRGPKVNANEMGSYSLSPFEHKNGPKLSSKEQALLREWVDKNVEVLQQYWDGEIAYTQDAIAQLKPV